MSRLKLSFGSFKLQTWRERFRFGIPVSRGDKYLRFGFRSGRDDNRFPRLGICSGRSDNRFLLIDNLNLPKIT